MDRIRFLDGLRGVAISEVVLYHGFTHYVSSYPFGDSYANIPLFRFGFIGVELFFMISGFVIFMTLKRCHNVMDFLTRRWLRLFPAMLLGALLIYGSAHLAPTVFVYRPSGMPVASQLAPSLLLLDPSIIQALTGVTVGEIEGSLWSIFVELKFYAFIGLAFFLFGEIPSLILLYTLSLASCALAFFNCWAAFSVLNRLGIVFFPWFAIGVLAFKYFETRKTALLLLVAPMFLCGLYIMKLDHRNDGYVCVIYQVTNAVLFLGPVALAALRPLLAWRAAGVHWFRQLPALSGARKHAGGRHGVRRAGYRESRFGADAWICDGVGGRDAHRHLWRTAYAAVFAARLRTVALWAWRNQTGNPFLGRFWDRGSNGHLLTIPARTRSPSAEAAFPAR